MLKKKVFVCIKPVLILLFCTGFSLALFSWGVRAENIMMIYIIGVLVIIAETGRLSYGIIASILSVGAFNFFFTEPFYTFRVEDPNYLITFLVFFIVAFIGSTLTRNIQKQATIAKRNERNTRLLYEMNSGLFALTGKEKIARYSLSKLSNSFKRTFIIDLADEKNVITDHFDSDDGRSRSTDPEKTDAEDWCLRNYGATGSGTGIYNGSSWRYLPLKTSSRVVGVIGYHCPEKALELPDPIVIEALASQIATAIERDLLYMQEEKNRLEIEKEKLRNSLLRSISHDIRTPLTGISGSADFILESYEKLDKKTLQELLTDISTDAVWLNKMVENLLNMTRIQEGKLIVEKKMEIVDDIAQEAVTRIRKFLGDKKLSVSMPKELLVLNVDAKLIVQVLVNILDNAIKHTKSETDIQMTVIKDDSNAVFKVEDNGGGILTETEEELFERFTSGRNRSRDSRQGMGLGLSICKAIIEAHGGHIHGSNNSMGGATFFFTLPLADNEDGDERTC